MKLKIKICLNERFTASVVMVIQEISKYKLRLNEMPLLSTSIGYQLRKQVFFKSKIVMMRLIQRLVWPHRSEKFTQTELACSTGVFLGGRNLVRVRNIVVVAIFDSMTVEDWGA